MMLKPGAEAYLPEPLWAALAPVCGVAGVFEHAQGLPFIWFLGVTLLSKNMNAPLLQRYNAKQAQLLDVVTFVPRIAIAVIAAAGLSPGHYDAAFSGIFSVVMIGLCARSIATSLATGRGDDELGLVSDVALRSIAVDLVEDDLLGVEDFDEIFDDEPKL